MLVYSDSTCADHHYGNSIIKMKEKYYIDSKNIRHMRYDEETQVLTVKFVTGRTYEYYDVPPEVWERIEVNPSGGQAFNKEVMGKFKYKEI